MTSSPTPDISSLSLSQQHLNDNYDYDPLPSGNARPQHYFQTSPPIPAQSQYNPLGLNHSPIKSKPTRSAIPTQWLENSTTITDNRSLSPPHNSSDFSSSGGSPPIGPIHSAPASATSPVNVNADDEIIPTAIVIKNIPFNVKRETLLDIIASLSIPTPYAFNYHLDQQGAFRGLAFANFRQAADADAVVAALNGFDVQGRKLRVEYKKVLQAGEKERIEREKAIRRMRSMQLEKEQAAPPPLPQPTPSPSQPQLAPYDEFGPVPSYVSPTRAFSTSPFLHHQPYSLPSLGPIPASQPYIPVGSSPPLAPASSSSSEKSSSNELDMNDPSTLEIYSRILLFKDDRMRDELAFSRTLTPKQRRIVHLIAQKLGVYHYSVGEGDERYAVVTRIDPQKQQQQGRHTLSRMTSAYLASHRSPQMAMTGTANTLRAKKSMPDMKTLQTTAAAAVGPGTAVTSGQTPRLITRSSNGNIREGYATIASPSRRSPGAFSALFGNSGGSNGAFGSGSAGSAIPPVPSLPPSVTGAMNNGGASVAGHGSNGGLGEGGVGSGVVRQPRGPGAGGFGVRRDRVAASESSAPTLRTGGFEARTHEPLDI